MRLIVPETVVVNDFGHVFQGRSPYGYENVPLKKKELSEEDARNRQQQTNNTGDSTNSTEKQEEETESEPPKPCKDHPNNVRCMKCINGSSGPRIRRFKDQIHGFEFNK